jgi:hypothetical protein
VGLIPPFPSNGKENALPTSTYKNNALPSIYFTPPSPDCVRSYVNPLHICGTIGLVLQKDVIRMHITSKKMRGELKKYQSTRKYEASGVVRYPYTATS